MVSESKEISIWISYEDTLENQSRFLSWIEILAKKNETVAPISRKTFFRNLSKATLTIGRADKVIYKAKDGTRIPMGNLHYFAEKLTYFTKPETRWTYGGKTYTIRIGELWNLLKEHMLRIYPYAQNEAIKMSAERFRIQARPGSVEYFPSSRSYKENH